MTTNPINRAWLAAIYLLTYLGIAGILTLFDEGIGKWRIFCLSVVFIPAGLSMLIGFGDDLALVGYILLVGLAIWGVVTRRGRAYLLFLMTLAACIAGCHCTQ